MKQYVVDQDTYFTICSVHNKILNIFQYLEKIDPSSYKTPSDLYQSILKEIEHGQEFIRVALEMGQNMENSLKYKNDIGFGTIETNIYNFKESIKEED